MPSERTPNGQRPEAGSRPERVRGGLTAAPSPWLRAVPRPTRSAHSYGVTRGLAPSVGRRTRDPPGGNLGTRTDAVAVWAASGPIARFPRIRYWIRRLDD